MNDIQQSFPWLQASWAQLSNYINQNRVPQALLISGKKGLAKKQLAKAFAQTLMCESVSSGGQACGKCHSCILFNAQTHPDYIYIEPEEAGKAIGIDIIRQLTSKLSLKPQFENYRLVLINSADCLNNASANAFLKYLEEPTERTCLILITDKPGKLPATIRSRCQKLQVTSSDQDGIKAWLQKQGDIENVDVLLRMSQGSPMLAKQMADNSLLNLRAECFKQWLRVGQAKENFVLIAEQWAKFDNQRMGSLLFWLTSWVMDIVKMRYDQHNTDLLNSDLKISLQEIAYKLDLQKMYKYYDFLMLSQQRLDTQLNKQLMFEEILIQWSELNNR